MQAASATDGRPFVTCRIAAEIGKCHLKDGLPQSTGTVLKDTATVAVLDRVVQRIGWGQPFDRGSGLLRRGRGVAIG
ncbi:MAG: hypothetical protein JO007_19855 [Alphaproteobacteria bacterium]|nr:hypothetical protein [Alphaproteobacteria bacterium]